MTTYLLITSDKPTELTASTDKVNWLPVVNADQHEVQKAIQTACGISHGEGSEQEVENAQMFLKHAFKHGEVVPIEGWEPEIVMSDGWQPTYNNPDNYGCEQPAEPVAYRLKRSEPVKPNNSPFDLLDLSPIEAKPQESLSPNEINNQKPETVREALQQHTLKRFTHAKCTHCGHMGIIDSFDLHKEVLAKSESDEGSLSVEQIHLKCPICMSTFCEALLPGEVN